MKHMSKMLMLVALVVTIGFGSVVIPNNKVYAKLRGDEDLPGGAVIPYLGGRQSPGDSIGWTVYDFQANGSYGQRIIVDDLFQSHIDWMKSVEEGGATRRCEWQFRYAGGSLYGEVPTSPLTSGYVQIDVTQDADPNNQRSVITYHYGGESFIDVDQGNGWGVLPNNPTTPGVANYIWPYIAVAGNNNIVMVTGDSEAGVNSHHGFLTTDFGTTWTSLFDIDSCGCLSQFLRASRNSDKVVHVWTQFMEVVLGNNQLSNDVYYKLSTDGGVNWGPEINVTQYTPFSSMVNGDSAIWAYNVVNAVFDNSDNLHIAWSSHMPYIRNDTLFVLDRSKCYHWDEISTTITTINSPSTYYNDPDGWWLDEYERAGAWQLLAHQPQLIVGTGNELFCVWQGNADTTDYSAAAPPHFINGELYGATSYDNGATWDTYKNLTNTPSPGAASGACMDEDYHTVCPYTVNDSIYITFVEDKDAGALPQSEGVATDNPVRCLVIHKERLGIEEGSNAETPSRLTMNISNPASRNAKISYALTNAGEISLKVYDRIGSLVRTIETGYKDAGVYNLNLDVSELANGTYFVRMVTSTDNLTRSLVVIH